MPDKLYSRRRIRIVLPDFRKLHSVKCLLLILLFTIIVGFVIFYRSAFPIFKASCETAAASKGNKIVNDEVRKVMQEYTYNDLITLEKDVNGNIAFIEANTFCINEIISKIISNIQSEFDKIPRTTILINMGAISGISILKNWDPKFEIELESAGNINALVRTEFKTVGINQTHHKIYLDIDSRVGIVTPFAAFGKDINSDVLLTEAVIVGNVPDTYYNLEGMDEVEDSYNFIE